MERAGTSECSSKLSRFPRAGVHSALVAIQQTLLQEKTAAKQGLIQSLDPRLKLLASLTLLVMISLLSNVSLLCLIAALLFTLAVISHIDSLYFAKRVWLAAPLFSALITFPLIFNWAVPGRPLWILFEFRTPVQFGPAEFPATLAVTATGLFTAARMILKVGNSVSVALLLILTTPWQKLFRALSALGVSSILVFTLAMTYRYLHMLLTLFLEMNLAKRSRTLRRSRFAEEWEWVAGRVGYLFQRSLRMGREIDDAMRSRGYQGEPRVLENLQWRARDTAAGISVVVFCTVLALVAF